MLSARILNDVCGVNSFEVTDSAQWTIGDTVTVYFQLIDNSLDTEQKGFMPAGRRYAAAVGATLSVVIDNIDNAKKVTKTASVAYPSQDTSIWKIDILSTDAVVGTANLKLTLTEGIKVTRGLAKNVIKVYSTGNV